MKKITLLLLLAISSVSLRAQQVKYYLTDQAGQPWGSTSNIQNMNTAFGAGNWIQGALQTVNINALFQPSVCLIYIDGGSLNANAMNTFVTANLTAIQNWVFAGGRLFLNAAPNQGGNQNWGFGGVTLNYAVGPYSQQGYAATVPAHPIYVGPAPISATLHSDNYYCHGYVTGPGITTIISNTVNGWFSGNPPAPKTILASKPWGSGMCLFGSMTNTSFHNPQPSAGNLRANMLTWLAVCCQQPTIMAAASNTMICSGQTTSLSASGAGIGGTYTINPGNITSSVAVVSPTATTIYSIAGTNTNACQGTATIQITVNPTPTVTPGNNSPLCRWAALNLTVNAAAGQTVAYSWSGPGGFTSTQQNPSIGVAQPSNTGVYSVNVTSSFTNGGICSNSGTTSVFVVPTNTIATSDHTVCQGSAITLTASVQGASAYQWSGPSNYSATVLNPPAITNASTLNAGNYVLTASFTTQGTTLVCTSTAVANASVVATSPVTVSLPGNICQYSTALLTVSTTPNALNYSWSGPNNFSASGTATSITNIQPASTGLYNVTATWAIGQVSCTINGANQINVVAVPNIAINQPISVCDPSNVQLTASSPGAISYNWTATNGFTSNIASPLLSAPGPSATGIYTVSTAYTNGALVCYNANTTQVTVNPILTFTLPAYKEQCFNSIYTVNGPSGATSYTWSGPGGYTDNNQILSIPSIQNGQAGTYTLTVNLGPCTTSATTKVDILSPISYTLTPGNKQICAGDNVTLTMGATGGSQNYAYNWNPSIYLGSPTGSVQYGQPQGTTIYNVTAYDITCPNYTISTSFTVTVNKAPLPDLQLEKAEGCEPLCLVYNSRTQSQADLITYDFGNGQLMQADSFAYCLNAGTYNLKINTRGKNGCSATYSYPAPIVVWPTPHSDISWDPDAPTVSNNHLTFMPSSQYGPVVEYLWQFQGANGTTGNDTSSLKNPMRTYDNAGKYPVMLISKTDKGCIDTTFKVITLNEDFTIFIPNTFTPNGDGLNDVFNVKGLGLKTEGYSMEIYDRWGELLYTTKDAYKGWDGLVKGIYAPNGVYVYKVKALGAEGEGKKEFIGHVTLMK